MRNRSTYTDRLLLRLWRTRAVQSLVLAGAAMLLRAFQRRGGSTLNYGFGSSPILDALDRFIRDQGAGSGRTGATPRVVDMPAKPADSPAPDVSPVDPPPST
jgi:hypothetical protein